MEILNVQLEGRRINVEISKVAEDVIITEEAQVEVLEAEVQKRRKLCSKT
jgi:hypothetical protein